MSDVRWAATLERRPAEVWTLASMYVGGALSCVLSALLPMSPKTPVHLDLAVAVVSLVVAAVIWLAGPRLGRPLLNGALALGVLVTSLIIARAATSQGAMVTSFAYVWQAVYAAHFFTRREAWAHAALVSAGYGAAILLNDLPDGLAAYLIVVGTIAAAVTVLSNLVERMRAQADTDQLTGLLNRTGFRVVADREHALASRAKLPLALVVVDLDGFKAVNDSDGHAAGDRLLGLLADSWKNALRSCDIVGRLGGDEFVLLLPGTTTAGAAAVLERLRVDSPLPWSAGVVEWGAAEDLDGCLARGDEALYEDKAVRRFGTEPFVPTPRAFPLDRRLQQG